MMVLAAATICFDAFDDTDFIHSFANLPACGYHHVEFNAWFPQNLTRAKARDLKRRCEQTGLTPAVLHGSGFGANDANSVTKDIAHKLRLLDMACEIGCRRICCTGSRRGSDGGLSHIDAVLEAILPTAEELDVLVCLENHAGNNLEFIEDYRTLLQHHNSPMLGICLDDGHFDASDVDMHALIDTLGNRINHVHVKENRGKGHVDFCRFGEGTTDHAGILQHLARIGYNGYVTVEISPTPQRPTTQADMRHANHVVQQMIDRAMADTKGV